MGEIMENQKDIIYGVVDENDKRWLDYIKDLEFEYKQIIKEIKEQHEKEIQELNQFWDTKSIIVENVWRRYYGFPELQIEDYTQQTRQKNLVGKGE